MLRDLDALINLPEANRDDAWEQEFLRAISSSNVELLKDQAQQGPDGWPYLLAKTGPQGDEPFSSIVQWAAKKGVGIAVNTHKMLPDYIFTYGMLWNFAETGLYVTTNEAGSAGQVVLGADDQVILGAPTEKYLPPYVRAILREFLSAQGFKSPKIVVMSSTDFKIVDLVFSTESLNGLDPSQHRVLAEAIGWFLPLHYSLIFGSEQNLKGFVDL